MVFNFYGAISFIALNIVISDCFILENAKPTDTYNVSLVKIKDDVASVLCPDAMSVCPDGNTCCKFLSGQYGCCPLPKAVCCSDGVYCCPSGYTCTVRGCSKLSTVSWISKISAEESTNDVTSVVCPGGQSMCPDGNTCCKLPSGQYGCCPVPKAVCCSDGVHCCPNGYTCNVGSGTCTKLSTVSWISKISAEKRTNDVTSVVCPGGQSMCPDGNTCCKLSSGQYGCCPIPKAVCCSDGVHCCPNGYTCNVGAGTCTKLSTISWISKISAEESTKDVTSVVCPGAQSMCPDGNTCCKLPSGQYGCCPVPKAVCCSDGVHCCPNGYTCNVGSGTCTKLSTVSWISKISAEKRTNDVTSVVCPGGQSMCPDGNTCCKLSSGQYGCCPIPKAVCCSDGVHCCPNGYTCNVGAGTCTKLSTISWISKISAEESTKDVTSVVCPGAQSMCPDGNTCCKLPSGQYGCCPVPKAVCCSDGVHCCPNGYTCNVGSGTCTKLSTVSWISKISAEKRTNDVTSVVCPGGQSMCPDGNTCCKLSSGQYGCCPIPKAVCCSDGVHCCPNGYTCNVGAGTCTKLSTISWISKISAEESTKDVTSVVCPGAQSMCPDGNTCCKLPSGQYGCCPVPKAVCCSDGVHCCPNGYTCNVGSGTCTKLSTVSWISKISAEKRTNDVTSVVCPGGQSMCPDGNTCCKLSSGQYGCCPIPKAVCCSDGVHCCPNGYTCNVGAGTCTKLSTISWISKISAEESTKDVTSVVCPGAQSMCPDGNTCCKLPSGQYGCCPVPKAVCCSDGVHCCPNGYTCNVGAGTCTKLSTVSWISKISAEETANDVTSVVCPGAQSMCPDGNTCCKLPSGQYGCCPVPKAVCCSDGVHCCPNGYTCNVGSGTCTKLSTVSWISKISAEKRTNDVTSVVCPGGQSMCPDGNTCCKLSSGQYGCCPIPKAVCCSDGVHCCPNGYTCNVGAGTCTKLSTISWISKISAKESTNDVTSVVCPGGQSMCPDGNTCCKLPSGQYGCCPVPKAVCCSDGVHCCPNGYTCNVGSGTCTKLSTVSWISKISAEETTNDVTSVVCPGGQSMCPDGNTCCKLPSGQYGCCPVPKAVCCSDGVHCCPNGYTCNVGSGTCTKLSTVSWISKISSEKRTNDVTSVVCPGGQSMCPDGNTCCKLSSGQYGCCPIPKAVCCSDGVHCCPNGYTCNVGAGTCTKLSTVSWISQMTKHDDTGTKKDCVLSDKCTMCKDGSECPSYYTCCLLSDGQYGCCKYSQAVCCSDHLHCCPQYSHCDLEKQVCRSQYGEHLLSQMLPSQKAIGHEKVAGQKIVFAAEKEKALELDHDIL